MQLTKPRAVILGTLIGLAVVVRSAHAEQAPTPPDQIVATTPGKPDPVAPKPPTAQTGPALRYIAVTCAPGAKRRPRHTVLGRRKPPNPVWLRIAVGRDGRWYRFRDAWVLAAYPNGHKTRVFERGSFCGPTPWRTA